MNSENLSSAIFEGSGAMLPFMFKLLKLLRNSFFLTVVYCGKTITSSLVVCTALFK